MRAGELDADVVPLQPSVVWIGAAAGMSSGVALVISIATERPLWLASTFILVPGLVAFVALTVGLRRSQQALFLARVRAGLIAGVVGTVAYDVFRWVVESTALTETKSFLAIRAFGVGLTDLPADHVGALAAGWAFHACNGIGFAIAYTLVAAGRHWAWGIVFALALETAMVLLYPGWLGITLTNEFLSLSISAHVAYGACIGVIARRTT